VQGKQAHVKNVDLRHPSCTVVMLKRKTASPVLNVLRITHKVRCFFWRQNNPEVNYSPTRISRVSVSRGGITQPQLGGGHLWVRWGTFGFHKCGEFLD